MPKGIYERKNPSWRKGTKLSEEHKRKISEARIKRKERVGYLNSPETRRKISETNKGRKHTEKTKRKMSGKIPWNKGLTKELDKRVKKYAESNRGKSKSEKHKKKLSESHKGNQHTKETRRKMSLAQTGEKNHQWLGGKSFEPYGFAFNGNFKKLIRQRDNNTCVLCNIPQEKLKRTLSIHHINYDKLNTTKENCCTLCRSCNLKVNFNRKHWTNFFKSLLEERYGYKY